MKVNKKIISLLIVLLLVMTLFCIRVFAEPEENVVENTVETDAPMLITERETLISEKEALISDGGISEGNKYIFDENFAVSDEVINGDVFAFGNGTIMNTKINGDLFLMGDSIELTNVVIDGDSFILAQTANINESTLKRAAYVMTETFNTKNCTFERELFLGTNKDRIDGTFDRDIYMMGNELNVSEKSVIRGNLYCPEDIKKGNNNIKVEGETITYELPSAENVEPSKEEIVMKKVNAALFGTLAVGIIIFIISKIDTNKIKEVAENNSFGNVLVNTLKGLGLLFIGTVLAIVLIFTKLYPLGILYLLFVGLACVISGALISLVIAYYFCKNKQTDKTIWIAVLIGFIFAVIRAINIEGLNAGLSLLFTMYSLGLITELLFSKNAKKENKTVAKEPVVVENKPEEKKEDKE